MTQRLTQAKLIRAHRVVAALIAAVHDARVRYRDCAGLRPGILSALSRHLKRLAGMPHTADYAPYEADVKRLVIRSMHRVHGYQKTPESPVFAFAQQLPTVYAKQVEGFTLEARQLLRTLADVSAS